MIVQPYRAHTINRFASTAAEGVDHSRYLMAACQKGLSVGFITASALVHELLEARDEKRLLRLQRQLAAWKLLIIDELGYVPLSTTGAALLFEVFSQRYERGSTMVTSNLPFDEWTSVFGSERLTGALLDRLTHHVHILEMNGDSFRLAHSKRRSRGAKTEPPADGILGIGVIAIDPRPTRGSVFRQSLAVPWSYSSGVV